ncbi:repulsive guidance molecule B-like isoform X1 [Ostrea edulis]|uniref:repulsive guidance molecule B-like isoform X1 n=1 Tax=Ostrea edulis TaxID=37623 RepID=UPI0020942473|nr:repulsive guidance molecule B-like isoform X1 [Ostrea edulis]
MVVFLKLLERFREYRSERSSTGRVPSVTYEWKEVMASLSCPPMPPILSLVVIFILVYLIDSSNACGMQLCNDRWRTAEDAAYRGLIKPRNGEDPICVAHRTHLVCLIAEGVNCKTNLQYQLAKRAVIHKMKQLGCNDVGDIFNMTNVDPRRPRLPVRDNLICTFRSRDPNKPIQYQHCGLFGDPHLRTFKDEFQTCKVEGAWSLVQNKHIVVMVTNNPVKDHVAATATSKLTVVIKKNDDCASHDFVTYKAQTNDLPGTFENGHSHAGPDESVAIRVMDPGKHVEIYLRFIDTTIRVRQIGRYFTFAMKMPQEIVGQSLDDDTQQLCVQGCPEQEQINYKKYLADRRKIIDLHQGDIAMTSERASELCRQSQVVDFYFDSCVFDLMTTGDKNFTVAAHQLLEDLTDLSPDIVKTQENRTYLEYDEIHLSSGYRIHSNFISWTCALAVFVCLLLEHATS